MMKGMVMWDKTIRGACVLLCVCSQNTDNKIFAGGRLNCATIKLMFGKFIEDLYL